MHDTQESVSQGPGLYNLSFAPKATPIETSMHAAAYTGGCSRQFHINSTAVDTYNAMRAQPSRPAPRPQTELVSTSVYKTDGMGYHRHIDDANLLQRNMVARSSKCVPRDQQSYFRQPPCLKLPNHVPLEAGPRGGVSTRLAPQYFNQECFDKTMC